MSGMFVVSCTIPGVLSGSHIHVTGAISNTSSTIDIKLKILQPQINLWFQDEYIWSPQTIIVYVFQSLYW